MKKIIVVFILLLCCSSIEAGDITKGATLPDSANKSDFYALVDTATINAGAIVNADVNNSAAIAGSKIDPTFGSQDISTNNDLDVGGNMTLDGTFDIGGNITLDGIIYNEDAKIIADLTKTISVTITKPLDLDEADTLPIFWNDSGHTINIDSIFSNSDTDDVNFILYELADKTDFSDLTIIGNFLIETDGTNVYYNLSQSGTLAHTTIENDNGIAYNNDATDDPDYVNLRLTVHAT